MMLMVYPLCEAFATLHSLIAPAETIFQSRLTVVSLMMASTASAQAKVGQFYEALDRVSVQGCFQSS